jgi:cardiolipin synthase
VTRKDIPNLITVFRFILIPPVVWFLWHEQVQYALVLFAIAGFSDALDGYLARRFDWRSRLGAVLDPLADKGLMTLTLIVMLLKDMMPAALVVIMILRDLVILAGATAFHFRTKKLEMQPSVISKLNTALQILLVVLVMWDAGVGVLSFWLLNGVMIVVFITTLLSGLDYVLRWSAKARHHQSENTE